MKYEANIMHVSSLMLLSFLRSKYIHQDHFRRSSNGKIGDVSVKTHSSGLTQSFLTSIATRSHQH